MCWSALAQRMSFSNVHPNPAGYRAMGDFVDLALFNR
jgi:lysophospholipase L1-like esterase